MALLTLGWMTGMALMAVYSVLSMLRLRRWLVGAIPLRDNIYLADHIASPFVLGVLRPKIYLPSILSEEEQKYISSTISSVWTIWSSCWRFWPCVSTGSILWSGCPSSWPRRIWR